MPINPLPPDPRPIGPNVRKLVARKMSLIMIPPDGNLSDAMNEMAKPGRIGEAAQEAAAWVNSAIALVKSTPDNPHGDDDEAIASVILGGIEDIKAKKGLPK